ncbi:uncharacterized protein [Nicotiana sylvestris]|uniref:uncharacterized protein n=1 Tax=Nicotiana sylvestris TaxID=4096 RepID=UPI00388C6DC3
MRPTPPGEGIESPIPKSGKDNKRKRASNPKDTQDETAPTRKLRRKLIHVDLDSAIQHLEDEENEGEESVLVPRTRKLVEVAKSYEPETLPLGEGTSKKDSGKAFESPEIEIVPPHSTNTPEGTSAEKAEANQSATSEELGVVTMGHSPSLPSYFEEAIVKFRAELSQCEAELRKASGEEKVLRLLCSQKEEELKDLQTELAKAQKNEVEIDEHVTMILTQYGLLGLTLESNNSMSQLQQELEMIWQLRGEVNQVKTDCHQWKENMDRLATDNEVVTSQLASSESQLRGIKVKSLAQAKKIEELEADLAKAGAEAAQAKAEVEKMKATTNKTIDVYLRDAEAVQAELREASDRENGGGEAEEGVLKEEEVPEDGAPEDAIPEDVASEDVTPK